MVSLSNTNVSLNELWPLIKEVIESGGEYTFYPRGTSMMPLIRPGVDQVVLIKPESIKKGDAVLYTRDNGQFVLHRVVKIKDEQYIMCGDNQFVLEYGIKRDNILAKMKAVLRDEYTIDDTSPKYKKYKKKLPFRRLKKRVRNILGRIKNVSDEEFGNYLKQEFER